MSAQPTLDHSPARPAIAAGTRQGRIPLWAILAVVLLAIAFAVVLPFVTTGYVIYIANLLLVFTVLSLGMHIVIGEAGQFSLAHAAFYGLGIYTAGLLNNLIGLPLILNLLAGGLVAALCGFAIGFLSLRMRDIYLALSTFAFGEAMQWVFLNWTPVTGGPNGLNFKPASLFGWTILSDKAAYPVVAIITLAFVAATLIIHFSTVGRSFRAVRESEIAAAAVGIDVKRVKLLAFTLSAFFAGAAGGLYTTFSTFIHPESLGFQTTILVLTMVVVGGIGSVWGAIGGAIVFGLIAELLRQVPSYQEVIYGCILMLFMMYLPRGVFSLFGRR
jgi:branched-chain amino acid transport system permease protein